MVDKSRSYGHRLYSSVFVDKIKPSGVRKSRFCVAAFNDKDHGLFTAAPTIKRISLRLILCMSSMCRLQTYTRDISQAFVKSQTTLRRDIYVCPPKEINAPDKVLHNLKPLYRIPESPIH